MPRRYLLLKYNAKLFGTCVNANAVLLLVQLGGRGALLLLAVHPTAMAAAATDARGLHLVSESKPQATKQNSKQTHRHALGTLGFYQEAVRWSCCLRLRVKRAFEAREVGREGWESRINVCYICTCARCGIWLIDWLIAKRRSFSFRPGAFKA